VVSRAEIVVFCMVACPNQSFPKARSAPASRRCVASECCKSWNVRFSTGSPAISPDVCMRWCSIDAVQQGTCDIPQWGRVAASLLYGLYTTVILVSVAPLPFLFRGINAQARALARLKQLAACVASAETVVSALVRAAGHPLLLRVLRVRAA